MGSDIYIASAARTPIGGMLGMYTDVSAITLGAAVIQSVWERAEQTSVDAVMMGCVLSAGLGQAPARQAALKAGLPIQVPCDTLNKMCGSGLEAIILAHAQITAGRYKTLVAGGMENMTRAPYMMMKGRMGYRLGHSTLYDHMMLDGLEDPYDLKSMGCYGDQTAAAQQIDRVAQDAYAEDSVRRAQAAIMSGAFSAEIVPVSVERKSGIETVHLDEIPPKLNVEKIPTLKPAFSKDGTVTAANSSSIADGAAAVLVGKRDDLKVKPLAKICGYSCIAREPQWFPIAPIDAISTLLTQLDWTVDTVDLFEINEAFAVVPLAAMKALNIPHDKVNVNGGACALGHPIGASGARILVTLLHALEARGLKRGIAALCIAGGEACAIAVERV